MSESRAPRPSGRALSWLQGIGFALLMVAWVFSGLVAFYGLLFAEDDFYQTVWGQIAFPGYFLVMGVVLGVPYLLLQFLFSEVASATRPLTGGAKFSRGVLAVVVAAGVLVVFGRAFAGMNRGLVILLAAAAFAGIALAIWWGFGYLWRQFELTDGTGDRLARVLGGVALAGCLFFAYESATSATHEVCTQSIRTRDGEECVGDYVTEAGPDSGGALIWLIAALGVLAVSVNFETSKSEQVQLFRKDKS